MRAGIFSFHLDLKERLDNYLELFLKCSDFPLAFSLFSSREELEKHLSEESLDLLFVDMDCGQEGEKTADSVYQLDRGVCQILISSDYAHAIYGYYVDAQGFLLKPVREEEFRLVLSRTIKKLEEMQNKSVKIKVNGIWLNQQLKDIAFVESEGHSLIFWLKNGKSIRTLASFKDYIHIFEANPYFQRCHKSFMVNIDYVKEYTTTAFILKNDSIVNISRQFKQDCKSNFINFHLKKTTE